MPAKVIHGDCIASMAAMDECSIDAIVTDPPYHLTSIVKRFGGQNAAPAQHGTDGAFSRASRGFMGQQWDGGDIAFRVETWLEAYRVLKPGGHLAAFGSSRGYHRMACAIEDAGFEIRDSLMWLYGTGFPKSHNLSGDWQGWGTALKPAHEPIVLARKPLIGTVAANVLAHGAGGLNIDACRVDTEESLNGGRYSDGKDESDGQTYGAGLNKRSALDYAQPGGRWPANVLHDGSAEVMDAFAAFGESRPAKVRESGFRPDGAAKGGVDFKSGSRATSPNDRGDGGTAARFFYSAKASAADRAGSKHPTVKPLALMRWLCTLVTPPGGTILDPFAGSGTTLQAAHECGFNAIGCEQSAEYVADIERRIADMTVAIETQPLSAQPDLFAA